jgi:hypothetical protein
MESPTEPRHYHILCHPVFTTFVDWVRSYYITENSSEERTVFHYGVMPVTMCRSRREDVEPYGVQMSCESPLSARQKPRMNVCLFSMTIVIVGLSEILVLMRIWALYDFNRRGEVPHCLGKFRC